MHRGQSMGYKKGALLRDGRYLVEREINRGGSAVVYLAQDLHHDNKQVALKVVDYTRDLQTLYKSVKREVQFSAHTQHPNIVQLLDVFADKQYKTLVIVWEFIHGPDLLECLNRHGGALDEDEAAFYFCQLLRGLLFMHQTGFAHRDLKPENCVLQDSTQVVKLIDFGLTKHIESARTMLVGTPEYMAPELVRNPNVQFMQYGGGAGSRPSSSGSRQGYDARKVDAWAMGVLFYVLIAAQYPFSDSNRPESGSSMATQRALLQGRYKPLPPHISSGARAIVQQLLVVEPQHRAGLEDIARDPWLLDAAMSYALPRHLEHLVQPPLAPTPQQAAEVAAAAAARSQQTPQQQQQTTTTMHRSFTGGSAVSAVSAASGATAVTTVSDVVSSESMGPQADKTLPAVAAAAPRTSSSSSSEAAGGVKEVAVVVSSIVQVQDKMSLGGDAQVQPPPPPLQQQQHDVVGQSLQNQNRSQAVREVPKRVMYASHTTYATGTGGKVGLGEQQLYAVRYEAHAAQRAGAPAADSANDGAQHCWQGASKAQCRCCVIC